MSLTRPTGTDPVESQLGRGVENFDLYLRENGLGTLTRRNTEGNGYLVPSSPVHSPDSTKTRGNLETLVIPGEDLVGRPPTLCTSRRFDRVNRGDSGVYTSVPVVPVDRLGVDLCSCTYSGRFGSSLVLPTGLLVV